MAGYSSAVLHCYEELEALGRQMLAAAKAGEWEPMGELQETYCVKVEQLRRSHDVLPLSDAERARRHERLRRILDIDAEIREILTPEWTRLSDLLQSSRRTKSLTQAYGVLA